MTTLAGIDIAQISYDFLLQNNMGFVLTLIQVEDGAVDPTSLTSGKAKTETRHSGYGIVEEGKKRLQNTIVEIEGAMVYIYAASLNGIVPKINDKVEIKSKTWRISKVETDPADAVFSCQCE